MSLYVLLLLWPIFVHLNLKKKICHHKKINQSINPDSKLQKKKKKYFFIFPSYSIMKGMATSISCRTAKIPLDKNQTTTIFIFHAVLQIIKLINTYWMSFLLLLKEKGLVGFFKGMSASLSSESSWSSLEYMAWYIRS